MKVNVIDLFAGPGGLGEGFFSFQSAEGDYPFQSICSIEMDSNAHKTLTLRAYYRKLKQNNVPIPKEYYDYAKGLNESPFNSDTESFWLQANSETLQLELGKDPKKDNDLFSTIKKKFQKTLNENPTMIIGGPPCQAYSLVGRARNKGNKDYIPEKDHRHFLYKEYLNIVNFFSPDIFVMENVKGMITSKVNGGEVFRQIINDLNKCGEGYNLFSLNTGEKFILDESKPKDLILCSENFGVPQKRHRVIIVGIKKKLSKSGHIDALKSEPITCVNEAIGDLPKLRSIFSNRSKFYKYNTFDNWKSNLTKNIEAVINTKDFVNEDLKACLKINLDNIQKRSELPSSSALEHKYPRRTSQYQKFVFDSPKQLIQSHVTRPHIEEDLVRYFYCSTYREVLKRNAKAKDFPLELAPNHKSWHSGKFADRFKVQGFDEPSSTITSHISKDGHYFIHPDPHQCRSLTVREAARIQTFPDSYIFMGERTAQFHQVGNAVPPLLASKIAKNIYSLFDMN